MNEEIPKNQDFVRIEILDNIATLHLDSPPGNLLPVPEFFPAAGLIRLQKSGAIKGIIIRGSGKNFSAGGDVAAILKMAGSGEPLEHELEAGHKLLDTITSLDIPVVAAIDRVCFGGGLEIALACHIRVASENALLAFPETNLNLMPGMGGTVRLASTCGNAGAIAMILQGDTLTAREALELKIIDHVAPRDDAWSFSMKLLKRMTEGRPLHVIRAVMTALANSRKLSAAEAMKEEIRLFCELARREAARRAGEDSV